MKKADTFKAFTLAEVLITLTIIGVIAAITVPTLIQRTNKQEYVTALKKAYSTLSQATNQIIAEEGSPKASEGGWASSADNVYSMFKPYLNILKDCGAGTECIGHKNSIGGSFNMLDKKEFDTNWNSSSIRKIILSDGTLVLFDSWALSNTYDCSISTYGRDNVCAKIVVDINGNKAPNTWGRDVFSLLLTENGLYPAGCDEKESNCISSNGTYCACKVLREGAMNY